MTAQQLRDYGTRLEALARRLGLDFEPVVFELVPEHFLTEIAVYGLPIRMRHWSFGLRYIHQLIQQHMGHSRIFEVMFPGDPCHAYMMDCNTLAENTLVMAHVLGHADFVRRNAVFAQVLHMTGGAILERSAARAQQIEQAWSRHGQLQVETVLDAALALDTHINVHAGLQRPPYPMHEATPEPAPVEQFQHRYCALPGAPSAATRAAAPLRAALPPHPETDLLWFMAHYGPALADWERDILLAVREEAFYFYPVHVCQIMNEGWASYWHARLLREADFLPPQLYLDAIRSHSDVVRPYAGAQQLALSPKPYHLGSSMWERIIARDGLAAARAICRDEDDTGFIRNYLDQDTASSLGLFSYNMHQDGETRLASRQIDAVREAILTPRYNYGAPAISITQMQADGTLVLSHDHRRDGCGLDLLQAQRVLDYVARIWRRPVTLQTLDFRGMERNLLAAGPPS